MARGRYVANARQRLAIARARLKPGAGGGAGGGKKRPWDSQAQRESAELGNEAADARTSFSADYDRAQRQLGFGAGADDPYSATALNKESLATAQRGIMTTVGNQLYAGSTANAQSAARGEYDRVQKGLEDDFAQAQVAHDQGMARTARDEAIGQAGIREGAIERAAARKPSPMAVGRGRVGVQERRNVRRPEEARRLNTQARRLNAQINARNRGRGRI